MLPMTAQAPQRAADVVYRELHRAILSGELAPNTRIRQSELASAMGVSLIPMREALTRLAADGLVLTRPRLGAYVAALSSDDAYELYAMRSVLEPLAVRNAGNVTGPSSWVDARRVLRELDTATDPVRYAELNAAFHLALYAPCAMPRLLRSIQQIWDSTVRYSSFWMLNMSDVHTSQLEHASILTALERGATEEAGDLLAAHIDNAAHQICSLITESEKDSDADR